MELEKFRSIVNRRYSPKEALAYFVISVNNAKDRNLDSLIISLKKELIKNSSSLLEKLERKSIEQVVNYWSLSLEQVIAYGYIVFNNLTIEKKQLTEEEITDIFVYIMRLYSPSNAEEIAQKVI